MSPRGKETSDEAIMEATYRVVSRLGPHLTLADVGKEAGISPATLVQRFGSKRDLLLAFAAQGSSFLHGEFERIRAAARTPLDAIYATVDCMAAMAPTAEALSNSLAFLQMDLVDPAFHKHAQNHSKATQIGLKGFLDEAIAAQQIEPCDTVRLARAVHSLIGGSLLQWAVDRDTDVTTRMRQDLQILLEPRTSDRLRRRHQAGRQSKTRRKAD